MVSLEIYKILKIASNRNIEDIVNKKTKGFFFSNCLKEHTIKVKMILKI